MQGSACTRRWILTLEILVLVVCITNCKESNDPDITGVKDTHTPAPDGLSGRENGRRRTKRFIYGYGGPFLSLAPFLLPSVAIGSTVLGVAGGLAAGAAVGAVGGVAAGAATGTGIGFVAHPVIKTSAKILGAKYHRKYISNLPTTNAYKKCKYYYGWRCSLEDTLKKPVYGWGWNVPSFIGMP